MRELTVRIRYTQYSLGNVNAKGGNLDLPRDVEDDLIFMPSWHKQNMLIAVPIFGKHHKTIQQVHWDPKIDVVLRADPYYKRTYQTKKSSGKRKPYAIHEAIFPGQVVGINCLVPDKITDDDFITLMNLAGRYKGLSPYKPGEYGRFTVESLQNRRKPGNADDNLLDEA